MDQSVTPASGQQFEILPGHSKIAPIGHWFSKGALLENRANLEIVSVRSSPPGPLRRWPVDNQTSFPLRIEVGFFEREPQNRIPRAVWSESSHPEAAQLSVRGDSPELLSRHWPGATNRVQPHEMRRRRLHSDERCHMSGTCHSGFYLRCLGLLVRVENRWPVLGQPRQPFSESRFVWPMSKKQDAPRIEAMLGEKVCKGHRAVSLPGFIRAV